VKDVNFNKEEMERIWNHEPVGFLKRIKKNRYKAFQVTLKPYTKIYGEPVVGIVYASSRNDAMMIHKLSSKLEDPNSPCEITAVELQK